MKINPILQNPVAKKMYDLKLQKSIAILNGRCKEARMTSKEFAKLAVDDFYTAIKVPQPVTGSFPWYSSFGLNAIKYMIYNLFCKKTPQEKQFNKLVDDYRSSLSFDLNQ